MPVNTDVTSMAGAAADGADGLPVLADASEL